MTHDPWVVGYWPGTPESPEEITVACLCGEWEYFSQAGAGGDCDIAWQSAHEQHLDEMEGR